MVESLLRIFNDPLIGKGLLSVLTVVIIFMLAVGLRRIIKPWIKDEERIKIISNTIRYTTWAITAVLLFLIWIYSRLTDYVDAHFENDAFLDNLLISVVWCVFFALIFYVARRMIAAQFTDGQKKQQYVSWSRSGFIVLILLILVRIWAFDEQFQLFHDPLMQKLYKSTFMLIIIYVLNIAVRRVINSLKLSIAQRHAYRKRAGYISALIYFVSLFPIWAGTTAQWTTILSAMGAGIALALHEVLLNFAGWVYLIVRRPFRTGDRIELGGVAGDVIDIHIFQATLLEIGNWVDGDQSTGRVVHLPHGQIFRKPLFNYTKGFEYIWNEFSTIITFESNWEAAKAILMEAGDEESEDIQKKVQSQIKKMAKDYLIYYKTFTPIVYTKIEDSGVKLTLRYLVEAKNRRMTENNISQFVLKAYAGVDDITLAYPTYRIYKQVDSH
ncbi:mechanosensitive ion channel [bacterium]|nr:mechanosensitive ion channel [bacterium]